MPTRKKILEIPNLEVVISLVNTTSGEITDDRSVLQKAPFGIWFGDAKQSPNFLYVSRCHKIHTPSRSLPKGFTEVWMLDAQYGDVMTSRKRAWYRIFESRGSFTLLLSERTMVFHFGPARF